MTGLEIGLLVIGAVFFVGSFFVSEKLSSSDMSEIEGLSEEQIKILLDKKLKDADSKIDESIEEKFNEKKEDFEAVADKETNERIMSIGEYADSVFKSMDKTHQEILFLYQMLNDKQESITSMTKTLGEAESHIRELLAESNRQLEVKNSMDSKTAAVPAVSAEEKKPVETKEAHKDTDENAAEPQTEATYDTTDDNDESSSDQAPAVKEEQTAQPEEDEPSEDTQAVKDKVLSMYHQGYTELEIAKETGKGMGEIQMILDIFDEKEDD